MYFLKQLLLSLMLVLLLSTLRSNAEDIIQRNGNPDILLSVHDANMKQAIIEARGSLDLFFAKQDEIGDHFGEFALKVGLPTKANGVEHIWVVNPSEENGKITGFLNNEPYDLVDGYAYTDKVEFTRDDVTDWTYFEGDKYYGHFTTRLLIQDYDVATIASFMADMHDAPTPQ